MINKETKHLICTICPRGCEIDVDISDGAVSDIRGAFCERGKVYTKNEVIDPRRILTTTIRIKDGPLLPVRSALPLPKNLLNSAVKELNHMSVTTPIKIGDVIVHNILGSGIDIVASRTVK
jgi:CxxC motif-containing protein